MPDNSFLLDLSHIEFVHKGSIAGQGVIFAGRHSVRVEGETLHSDWFMPDVPLPSVAYGRYPPETRVDHWLEMRWNAPASMRLMIGACPHGQPRETGFELPQAPILTPASEHESHYFWGSTRYDDLESAQVDAMLIEMLGHAFNREDKPMIEAAYANVRGKDFLGGATAVARRRQGRRSGPPHDRSKAQVGKHALGLRPARGRHRSLS